MGNLCLNNKHSAYLLSLSITSIVCSLNCLSLSRTKQSIHKILLDNNLLRLPVIDVQNKKSRHSSCILPIRREPKTGVLTKGEVVSIPVIFCA